MPGDESAMEAPAADMGVAATPAIGSADDELDRQAQTMAEKALENLPESARSAKLPKVKEGILKRLRAQAATAGGTAVSSSVPGGPGVVGLVGASGSTVGPPPTVAPPPPPLPAEDSVPLVQLEGIESCGDEAWFADLSVRRSLRESVVAAHAEQKILVGAPADEIARICPGGGRVLGAGAVLRLGGAHLGGYGESDIAYAYRQLSRALHPDKHPNIPEAADAFKRLSEAADELRQGLTEARSVLCFLCQAMCGKTTPEMLERPQEALFAEATRLLSAVLAASGEGEVPGPASGRMLPAFTSSTAYNGCPAQALLAEWFDRPQLLELFASAPLRTAYDCSPKRFRTQFLCALNRVTLAEAKRHQDCVRGNWQNVMMQFPEIGLWRDLREQLKTRVWTPDPGEDEGEPRRRGGRRERRRDEDDGGGGGAGADERGGGPRRSGGGGSRRRDRDAEEGDRDRDRDRDRDPEREGGDDERRPLNPPTPPPSSRQPRGSRWDDDSGRSRTNDDSASTTVPPPPPPPSRTKNRWDDDAGRSRTKNRWDDDAGLSRDAGGPRDGKRGDPVCWNYAEGHCRHGDQCRYLHHIPDGYDAQAAKEARAKLYKARRKPEARTSGWARTWRETMRAVLPSAVDGAAPVTDPEVRRLCAALWRDVAAWARKEGDGQQQQHSLELFAAEPGGRADPAKGIDPGGHAAEWSFVPAADLLLVVGEGIVGITAEGVFADTELGYGRLSFAAAVLRVGEEAKEAEKAAAEKERRGSGADAKDGRGGRRERSRSRDRRRSTSRERRRSRSRGRRRAAAAGPGPTAACTGDSLVDELADLQARVNASISERQKKRDALAAKAAAEAAAAAAEEAEEGRTASPGALRRAWLADPAGVGEAEKRTSRRRRG